MSSLKPLIARLASATAHFSYRQEHPSTSRAKRPCRAEHALERAEILHVTCRSPSRPSRCRPFPWKKVALATAGTSGSSFCGWDDVRSVAEWLQMGRMPLSARGAGHSENLCVSCKGKAAGKQPNLDRAPFPFLALTDAAFETGPRAGFSPSGAAGRK
ncbi:hypothetical protein NA57DRAFT_54069 [Rhizodiscina lignyota]|uniref:Uncharacterized protein n=1 Tax=Rhizodiscina lignyota TaxID=1504668 RepID=A0A9P4ME03_9PEZI|nr:hypothetical protein NA57DRAFT_54069 [Rhizodiscina lignyota]